MAGTVAVRARYDDFAPFERALHALKVSAFDRYEAYGPVDIADIEDLMPKRGSTVRVYATIGAFIGLSSFFFMCTASSLIYSLITGGKPPISNWPFIIVSYEGTILLGAISAFFAVLALARLQPALYAPAASGAYDPRFSGDSFGIVVECEPEQRSGVIDLLNASGASEINELD